MAFDDNDERFDSQSQDNPINDNLGVDRIKGVPTIDKVPDRGYAPKITPRSTVRDLENKAKEQAQLEVASGVSHVLDDAPTEDYVSTKELYKKNLGVTEYDELRAKLHLKDDESFTDYYNRTKYIPKGFEIEAKLLLAEEKRKGFYAEYQAGNMSEEDFLYQAYGKDLLKQEGIDFENPLYWYQRIKNTNDPTRFEDPRDNGAFLMQLIENSKLLFQEESWAKAAQQDKLNESLGSYVTGEELPAQTVAELFPEFFEGVSEYYDSMEQIVKYYRAGLLQGFDPTIDADQDGKVDYYYAPDGKLYNVNETGKGANTVRAVYNDDGSLNRIVFSDEWLGEVAGSFFKAVGRFFTDVIDLGVMAVGAIVDVVDGDGFGETLANWTAASGEFWNSIPILQDRDYIVDSGWKTSDGKFNGMNVARQTANLVGYIVPSLVLAYFTGGTSVAGQMTGEVSKAAVKTTGKAAAKKIAQNTTKKLTKGIIKQAALKAGHGLKVAAKATGKAAVSLVQYNYGFGGKYARVIGAAVNAARDSLQTTAILSVNQEQLGLTDGEIIGKSLGLAAIEFTAGYTLRSVGDETAIKFWANKLNTHQMTKAANTVTKAAPNLWKRISEGAFRTSGEKAIVTTINSAADLLENTLSAGLQTSLSSSGEMFNAEGWKSALTNPAFIINSAMQAWNNTKDDYRITPNKIAKAAVNAVDMEVDFKGWIRQNIDEAQTKGDVDSIKALQQLEAEYTRKVAEYMDKEVTVDGEKIFDPNSTTTNMAEAQVKRYQEFIKEQETKIKKINDAIQEKKNALETNKTNKTLSDETVEEYENELKDLNNKLTRANDELTELKKDAPLTAKNTKAEAILRALEDMTNELELDENSPIIQKWSGYAQDAVRQFTLQKNRAMFDQINANHASYITWANDMFMGGPIARLLYGKDAADFRSKLEMAIYNAYYNKGLGDEYNIIDQIIKENLEQARLYEELFDKVDPEGKLKLDDIKLDTMVGEVKVKLKKDGTPRLNRSRVPIWEFGSQWDNISKEAKLEYVKHYSSLSKSGKADATKDILVRLVLDGSEHDGDDHFRDKVHFMNATIEFWDDITDGLSPIVKLDDNTYIIKHHSLGQLAQSTTTLGLFVKSLNDLKLSTDSANSTQDSILSSVRNLLGVFCDRADELTTVLEDNPEGVKSLINAMVKTKAFDIKEAAYILKVVEDHYAQLKAENKKLKVSLPPSVDNFTSGYDKAMQLKGFISDFDDIQRIIRDTGEKELTTSDVKTIRQFLSKYSPINSDGSAKPSEIRDLAKQHGLITTQQINALKNLQAFLVGETSTALESLKKERVNSSSSSNTLEVSTQEVTEFLNKIILADEQAMIYRKPYSKKKSQAVPVNIREIGSLKDYKRYLSSLKTDADTLELRSHYIDDTIQAIKERYLINDETYLVDLQLTLEEAIDTTNSNYVRRQQELTEQLLQLEQVYSTEIDISKIEALDKQLENLNNYSNVTIISLDTLTGSIGAKLTSKLLNQDNVRQALSKSSSLNEISNVLFSDPLEAAEFRRQYNYIQELRAAKGTDYIAVHVDSQEFKDICSNLGYDVKSITSYVNNELLIPGFYHNSNTRGFVLAKGVQESVKLKRLLENKANDRRLEQLKNSITFKDPLEMLDHFTSKIPFITEDTEINPNSIIINTLGDASSFQKTLSDFITYNRTQVKKGKTGGALFKAFLSSSKGLTITSPENELAYKIISTYKIINCFSKVWDNTNEIGDMVISNAKATTLKKTFEGLEPSPYIFIKSKNKNSDSVICQFNRAFTAEEFTKVAFNKIKKSGLSSIEEFIPLNITMENGELKTQNLRNNLTRAEATKLGSVFTPLTFLEANLGSELDVYQFITKYSGGNLNLGKVSLTKKDYDKAVKFFEKRTVKDALADNSLSKNVFVKMQKKALQASLELSSALKNALLDELPEGADVDSILAILGNTNARRSLGEAIRTALLNTKDSLSLDNGYINITDNLVKEVISSYKYTNTPIAKEQSSGFTTQLNKITGTQLDTLNPKLSKVVLDDVTVKSILEMLELEYSHLLPALDSVPVESKILALIESSSFGSDNLNISKKDLYQLSPEELDTLLSYVPNKQLKKIVEDLKDIEYYKSLYSIKEGSKRKAMSSIVSPSVSQGTGEIISGFDENTLKPQIDRLIKNAAATNNLHQFVKISGVDTAEFQNNKYMNYLSNQLSLYTIPFIKNTGSLQLMNLNIAENTYYFKKNLAAFATGLKEFGISNDAALELAKNYYLYSSGMQQQGAHPEFIIVDKTTGKVIDVAMSGSAYDRNEGLISRLYNDYFEIDNGELKLRSTINYIDINNDTQTVDVNNLTALRLNRNALNTTFSDGNMEISMYDFEGHQNQFADMIKDKIRSIAWMHDHSLKNPDHIEKIMVEVQSYFNNLENVGEVNFNRRLLKEGTYLYKKAQTKLISSMDRLSYLNSFLSDRENALKNNKLLADKYRKELNAKEVELNDIIHYGLTSDQISDTLGAEEFLADTNKLLSATTPLIEKLEELKKTVASEKEWRDAAKLEIKNFKKGLVNYKQRRKNRKDKLYETKIKKEVNKQFEEQFKLVRQNNQSRYDSFAQEQKTAINKALDLLYKDVSDRVNKFFQKAWTTASKKNKDSRDAVIEQIKAKIKQEMKNKAPQVIEQVRKDFETKYLQTISSNTADIEAVKKAVSTEISDLLNSDKTVDMLNNTIDSMYLRLSSTQDLIDSIYDQLNTDFNEIDDLHILINSVNKLYSNMLHSYNNGDYDTFETLKDITLNLSDSVDEYSLAKGLIKEYIRTSSDTETQAFKLLGCNLESFKTRAYENSITINEDKTITFKQLKNHPMLVLDVESFYDEATNTSHVYQIAIGYMHKGKMIKTAEYYIPDPKILKVEDISTTYPSFYENYYKKNEGTRASVDKLLSGNFSDTSEFFNLLDKAQADGAIFVGYNSKNFDIPKLLEGNIIDQTRYAKLLANNIDVYDIIQTVPTQDNLHLYGGRATLEAVYEQLFNKKLTAHNATEDIKATGDVLQQIIKSQVTQYEPKLYSDIKNIYLAVTGNQLDEATFNRLTSDLKQFGLQYDDVKGHYNTDLEGLVTHLNKAVTLENDFYGKSAKVLQIINERDINKKVEAMIRNLNTQLSLGVSRQHLDFAEAFANNKVRNTLIDIVAFKLQHLEKVNDADKVKEIQKTFTYLSKGMTEKILISNLSNNKKDLLTYFDIDQEEFNKWKASKGSTSLQLVKDSIKQAYGDSLSTKAFDDNIKNSLAYSLKYISDDIEAFDFIPDTMKNIMKKELSNLYDYKGKYSKLTRDKYLDLFSNYDKDIMDYLLTDPVTSHTFESLYRLAQTVTDEPITLIDGSTELLKNDTIYMTYDTYCNLLDIDPIKDRSGNNMIPQPEDLYVPVIRHPLDKFDSIHFFKVKLIKDGQGIDTAINITTMLSKLNGDFDGDHISIFRPSPALSAFAKAINDSGKNHVYNVLDDLLQELNTGKYSRLSDTSDHIKTRDMFKLHTNKEIREHVRRDLVRLNSDSSVDYDTLKQKFLKKFVAKGFKESHLEDIYIKAGVDVRDMVYNGNVIYYTDLLSLNTDKVNIAAKRAYTVAQMSKYKILSFTDTQTGMFQKGFMYEDYSKYGDIDLIDNAIRLDNTTKRILDSYSKNDITKLLTKLLSITYSDNSKRKSYSDLVNMLNTDELANSAKVETILRMIQFKDLNTDEYKQSVVKAVATMKNSTADDPFVKAYKRFVTNNTEDEFFKTITDIVSIKEKLKGNKFAQRKDPRYLEALAQLAPSKDNMKEYFKTGKEVSSVYVFDSNNFKSEDQVTFVKWNDKRGKPKGASKLQAANAFKTNKLDKDTLSKLNNYSRLELMTKQDVESIGLDYNGNCDYRFVDIINDQVIFVQSFNIDTAKTISEGSAATKATPAKSLTDLSEINDTVLKDLIQNNDISLIRDMNSSLKTNKISEDYTVFKDARKYTLYDSEGKITTDKSKAKYAVVKENIQLLELPQAWRRGLKETSLEELSYGNNMLGTGGIGLTYGIFIDEDELGNGKLIVDTERYRYITERIHSLNNYNRYDSDAKSLYEQFAIATIVKHLDESELEGKSREDFFIEKMSTDRQTFIHKHLKLQNKITDNHAKLLSKDLYNRIYGITKNVVDDPDNIKVTGNSGKDINSSMIMYGNKKSLEGGTKNIYDLRNEIGMSKREFINYMNEGRAFLSAEVAKQAEISGLLLNKQLPDDTVPRETISNVYSKTGQILSPSIEFTESDNSLFADRLIGNIADYYSKFKYDGDMINELDLPKIYGTNILLPKSPNNNSDYINPAGQRMANLVSSLFDARGTYTDKDTIVQSLNPNIKAMTSVTVPYLFRDSNGNIANTQRRISIGPKGYSELDIAEARKTIYSQRTSPYYWNTYNKYKEKQGDILDFFINKYKDTKQVKEYDDVMFTKDQLQGLKQEQIIEPEAIRKYREALEELDVQNPTEESHPTSYAGEITDGYRVGRKVYTEKPWGLNQGLEIKDHEDLMQNQNIRQVVVDQQYKKQQYTVQLDRLATIATEENCLQELNTLAKIISINNGLKYAETTNSPAATKDLFIKEANSLGISDTDLYIKNFEQAHPKTAQQFYSLIKTLDTEASKYSKVTNEPGENIFFLLTPFTGQTLDKSEAHTKHVVNMINKPYKHNSATHTGSYILDSVPDYNSYNLFESLDTTIEAVSKRAAIYENSVRLKQQGAIDSLSIQHIMLDTFDSPELIDSIRSFQSSNIDGHNENLRVICDRMIEQFPGDADLVSRLTNLKEYSKTNSGVTTGELYLELLDILKGTTENFKHSLDDSIALASQMDSADYDNMIYVYRQLQDTFAQIASFEPKVLTNMFIKLDDYRKKNGLAFVDKYGRLYDKNNEYKLTSGSLEHLPKALDKYMSGFENHLVTEALVGNVYFMDEALANVFAKRVFVKETPTKIQSALRKTSSWCVKMLMISPFKLIDRLFKFTLFDAASLNTANHNTMFKQVEAFKELRAFFASRGSYKPGQLGEFLRTQGVSLDGSDFDAIISGDPSNVAKGVFKVYSDKVNNTFTFQTLFQRYAYWLATKESIEKGDYSTLGSAYHLKEQMKKSGMTPGEQASFAMAQNLGSINDFPAISQKFNQHGFVFTTFPLAAVRWGVGELRSATAALQSLFTEGIKGSGAKWLARNSCGIMATYMLEQLLVQMIASMYGVDEDSEELKEWKEVGALPNITQTLIQGQPIMDTFSSMNASREIVNLFVDTKDEEDSEDTGMNGITRFILKNVVSRVNPLVKNVGEVVLKKDLIDDQIIDTKDKYGAFENVFRKASSYIIGAGGANQLTKSLFNGDSDDNLFTRFNTGFQNAINAELGNTKAIKESRKNYYNSIKILNEYLYADQETVDYGSSDNFDYARYNTVKSEIYALINAEASADKVYEKINTFLNTGYSLYEVRAALKNCSISGKLSKVSDYDDLLEVLSDTEVQNIKTALAYEKMMYPWLEDSVNDLTSKIDSDNLKEDNSIYYNYRPRANYNYNNYSRSNYTFPRSSNNYTKQQSDSYDAYTKIREKVSYNNKQAQYEANKKKWGND